MFSYSNIEKSKLMTKPLLSLLLLTAILTSCDPSSSDTYLISNDGGKIIVVEQGAGTVTHDIQPGQQYTVYVKSGMYESKGIADDYLQEASIKRIVKDTVVCKKDPNNSNYWNTQKNGKRMYTHTLHIADSDF